MKKNCRKFLAVLLINIILFSFLQVFFIKNEVQALSGSYTQHVEVGIASFPESYQIPLAYLKYLHPSWKFKAYYTGISWDEVTSSAAENRCLLNTIYRTNTMDGAVLCKVGHTGDPGYYCASAKTVNYYLDPRNSLSESSVFQFLSMSNDSNVSRSAIEKAVSGTCLNNYVDAIVQASNESGINPFHIISTIFQEVGREGSRSSSGTVSGYEGLYNFYNYGATDGSGAVERGLAKARELGWTSPEKSIVDGAKIVLANGYIGQGQNTKYFYKFDVVGNEIIDENSGYKTYNSGLFFGHQYMTNIQDPSNQASSLFNMYANGNMIDEDLTFIIPVYDNMPSSPIGFPTSFDGGNLYYVNTMNTYGVQLRTGPGTNYGTYGNIYKGSIVTYLGQEGSWTKVRVRRATSNTNLNWNNEDIEGWISSEYVAKVGEPSLPDFRGQVDMGSGQKINENSDFAIRDNDVFMTPITKVSDIKSKYPNASITKQDGSGVSDNDLIGTGFVINIDGTSYTAVKLGDSNGDGIINSGDLLKIQKHLLKVKIIDDQGVLKASDANKDGVINSGDLLKIQKYLLKVSNIDI